MTDRGLQRGRRFPLICQRAAVLILRTGSFHNYVDYALSEAFHVGFARLRIGPRAKMRTHVCGGRLVAVPGRLMSLLITAQQVIK
jgi:hypothetical protein